MTAYDITFHAPIGQMTQPVEADTLALAVAKATAATIIELEQMTDNLGGLFSVEPGEATLGFGLGLGVGDITIEVVEVEA